MHRLKHSNLQPPAEVRQYACMHDGFSPFIQPFSCLARSEVELLFRNKERRLYRYQVPGVPGFAVPDYPIGSQCIDFPVAAVIGAEYYPSKTARGETVPGLTGSQ